MNKYRIIGLYNKTIKVVYVPDENPCWTREASYLSDGVRDIPPPLFEDLETARTVMKYVPRTIIYTVDSGMSGGRTARTLSVSGIAVEKYVNDPWVQVSKMDVVGESIKKWNERHETIT